MGSISNGYRSFVENDMRNQVLEKLNPSRDCVFYCIRDEINQFLDALSNGKSELEKICFNESEDVFV